MGLKTITVRVPEEQLSALDAAAEAQHQDRSFVLNEALNQYLALQEYHRALVEEGLRQADAGDLMEHAAVKQMAETWSGSRKSR